ncbi:hypothetical protein PHLGIDRAFT_380702 [Phlebiopsis gigantea 11061_1 CR5-6]|uniref:Heterokaryon incompatibility domain-containing protein n=1 Tax=Phlebiopsis gigantea (strain 11061_1 CR5-6) TaxID=745531 RepID=A0A0C3NT45_PHLG1|nr:hypothetical protein PHLGIDRAFT_380702 [Phlebiopsis gigantea 11061_1 CR5-6]
MGAEYVFLDILCLRQSSHDARSERLRAEEWKLDIPTLGWIYRHDRYQTTIAYFNGLGLPCNIPRDALNSKSIGSTGFGRCRRQPLTGSLAA